MRLHNNSLLPYILLGGKFLRDLTLLITTDHQEDTCGLLSDASRRIKTHLNLSKEVFRDLRIMSYIKMSNVSNCSAGLLAENYVFLPMLHFTYGLIGKKMMADIF